MSEPLIRLSTYLGVLIVLAVGETIVPRGDRGPTRLQRWPINLGLSILNTLVLRLVFPAASVGAAAWAAAHGWGLFNVWPAPPLLAGVASIILLDLAIYGQHRLFHASPWFWRVHRLHHIDLEVDVTTAVRFHPLEMLLSMIWKYAVVIMLGAPAAAVLVFEILLNAASMFSHARIALPDVVDSLLRRVLVTPDMHRIHHSVHRDETDSNYGFLLSAWDRLFGSYRAAPREPVGSMALGVEGLRSPEATGFLALLLGPFRTR